MHNLDQTFLDSESLLRDEIQTAIEDSGFYCKNVKKSKWPNSQGYQITYPLYDRTQGNRGVEFVPMANVTTNISLTDFGISLYTMNLKKAAIHSPDICLDDLKYLWQIKDIQHNVSRVMLENAKWLWETTFQDETLKHCSNHFVTRKFAIQLEEILQQAEKNGANIFDLKILNSAQVQHPPRINFRGKRVYAYTAAAQTTGWKHIVNPKYKKAAEQVIVWHPDIVEFLFPDLEHWVGDLMYRNIPDSKENPNGTIGFYRMLFSYGARPLRPDLGTVITVLPPGLKGWLWYWAWKLVGFKP